MNAKEQQANQISRVDRAATILDRALELNSPERDAYIEGACGDDVELRQEVEAMLQAHEEAGDFLAAPTNENAATIPSFPNEKPGTIIDRYKILQLIGEGGFGAVYMAEQQKPVKRRVALKIIKLGMDTKQVIARFEAERQALAMMDHPNIARVFDAGSTETGRPYFVMELVKGVPITEYCDTENLSTKDRLDLFIDVCHAVQHAHQKGIIHRDIKPSNVMVTLHDGKPVPKVIDFGIAKATNRELTDKTLFTEYRQLIGTPQYMSPEQAEMSGLDIDTRSDIYSLGVLLYELLTGTTPFDPKRLRSAALGEIQRIIREEEPDKPSTRLSEMSRHIGTGVSPVSDERDGPADSRDDRSTQRSSIQYIAKHRKTEPAQLSRQLRGDLDWIIMKALEKERARRYETANGLAADIQRHLSDEPVLASPPSAVYQVRKFVRRHRQAVIAGGVMAGVLVLGVVGTTFFMFQAQANLEKFNLVAIGERLRQAKETEELLYPAWPEKIQVIEDWIREEAQPLNPELSRLERGLSDFRARTTGLTDAERFLSDLLQTQTVELQAFLDPKEGTLARVKVALIWAKAVGDVSITAHADIWEKARLAIGKADGVVASELYADPSIDLRPQLGLVPIGMNPVTKLWEFYHLRSAWDPASGMDPAEIPIPEHHEDGSIEVMEETGIVFVLIPGGNFRPNNLLNLSSMLEEDLGPYFLARHELTVGQWERLSGRASPGHFRTGEDYTFGTTYTLAHPVEQVSLTMCKDLLAEHSLVVPTQAQWEYACRAGTTTSWFTGDEPESLEGYANVLDQAALVLREGFGTGESFDDGFVDTAPVGSFLPNRFGLFDMHGNVEELCRNPTRSDTYLRGGSFYHPAWRARSSFRFVNNAEFFAFYIGVRASREIPQ